jgi:hypothetical protein
MIVYAIGLVVRCTWCRLHCSGIGLAIRSVMLSYYLCVSSIRTRSPRLVEDGHRAVGADVDPKELWVRTWVVS